MGISYPYRRLGWTVALVVSTAGLPALPAVSANGGTLNISTDSTGLETEKEKVDRDKPWHIEFGVRDSCTKLGETKQMLDRRLDLPLRLDVYNLFETPETPIDRKSDFLLLTAYLGLGRQESDWLVWTIYAGGGTGSNDDHQRVGIVNLEVDFKYAYVYTGAAAEIYPWHVPIRAEFAGWEDRLAASRPFLITGLETGYVSAEGRGHWSIAPFKIYQDKALVRDWITSFNLGLGWNLPISRKFSFILTGDYRWHFYRPDEYNSWTITTALRYTLP